MTALGTHNRLGSSVKHDEFQVDRTLVWIDIPPHGERDVWLTQGNNLFDEIWSAIPDVMNFGQQESRKLLPMFWSFHDAAGTSESQLTVWGIWIDPEHGSAVYEVNRNHLFDGEAAGLPEYPEGQGILVLRDALGQLSHRNPSP